MRKVGRPKGNVKQLTTIYLDVNAIKLLEQNHVNRSQFFSQVALLTFADPIRLLCGGCFFMPVSPPVASKGSALAELPAERLLR